MAERRSVVVEREREYGMRLSEALATVQRQVEQRMRDWRDGLDRTQATLTARVCAPGRKPAWLVLRSTPSSRPSQRLAATTEEQKAGQRLRPSSRRLSAESVASVTGELDAQRGRRRALRDRPDTLERREHGHSASASPRRPSTAVASRVAPPTSSAPRASSRGWSTEPPNGSRRPRPSVRGDRQGGARMPRRLGRELDRAVEQFTREAEEVPGRATRACRRRRRPHASRRGSPVSPPRSNGSGTSFSAPRRPPRRRPGREAAAPGALVRGRVGARGASKAAWRT